MNGSILLLEDDANICFALRHRLESAGYEVLQAPDAITATAIAKQRDIDVAVIDINLPIRDGLAFAQDLQGISAHTRFLFITADRSPALRKRAEALCPHAFIAKPFTGVFLLMQVEAAMRARNDDAA